MKCGESQPEKSYVRKIYAPFSLMMIVFMDQIRQMDRIENNKLCENENTDFDSYIIILHIFFHLSCLVQTAIVDESST